MDGAASLVGLIFHVFFAFGSLGGAAHRTFSRATIGVVVRVPSAILVMVEFCLCQMVDLLCRNNTGGSIEKVSNVGRWEIVGLEWFQKGEV